MRVRVQRVRALSTAVHDTYSHGLLTMSEHEERKGVGPTRPALGSTAAWVTVQSHNTVFLVLGH